MDILFCRRHSQSDLAAVLAQILKWAKLKKQGVSHT